MLVALKGREDEGPKSWLMDKIKDYEITRQKASLPPGLRIGEYIQKAVNMYNGEPQKVRLKVAASNIEFLKRKFPEVSISQSYHKEWYDVSLEVLGLQEIELWILQQGLCVEVLGPVELRENVKKLVGQMHEIYFRGGEQASRKDRFNGEDRA